MALRPLAAARGSHRPISRGASCQPSLQGACPWTDGQLVPAVFTEDLNEAAEPLVITLPEPRHLVRAVIRGLKCAHVYVGAERLRLEGSADGEHWVPLAHTLLRSRTRREANLQTVNEAFAHSTSWGAPFDGPLELYNQLPVFLEVPLESAVPVRHVRLQVEVDSSDRPVRRLYSLAEISLFEKGPPAGSADP